MDMTVISPSGNWLYNLEGFHVSLECGGTHKNPHSSRELKSGHVAQPVFH
jgi:hypothetical protein